MQGGAEKVQGRSREGAGELEINLALPWILDYIYPSLLLVAL